MTKKKDNVIVKKSGICTLSHKKRKYTVSISKNNHPCVCQFQVDIGTSEPASLSYLAFEGATKKNKPNIVNGDVVYAKVITASKDMESELVCVDAYGKKSGLGQLSEGGLLFLVPLHIVRNLLSPTSVLLQKLGETLKFEIAIGMNGRIWVRASTTKETIGIANAIWAAEHMTNAEITVMISKLADALAGF